ncbi:MAG TPA: lipid-A-disaccharide synthase [Kiritimatiellia bacterium]|nr:lipid-A-disaccharide synthase [Kiritimatiellia bacterium]
MSAATPSILVVAGEPSGDLHAARLVEAVKRARSGVQFYGIGGEHLRAAGADILVDAKQMAVLGLWEVAKRYLFFRRVFDDLKQTAAERRPDLALLVDYPGFNLRFAAELNQLGIPVVYYICPQVWAWHRSRIGKMARLIRRLLVIFPFEVDVFKDTGLRVDYVGHPLVDEAAREQATPRDPLPWPGSPRIAMLPGSRRQEIERILPAMWQAAGIIQQRMPDAGFILAGTTHDNAEYAHALATNVPGGPTRYAVVHGRSRQILGEATAAWVKSGTSTIEAALMNCPMRIVYKTSPITYAIAKRLIQVPHLGMANLIAGREAFTEYLQHDATPERLADGLMPLLTDTPERAASLAALREVQHALGTGGAAARAAQALLEELDRG